MLLHTFTIFTTTTCIPECVLRNRVEQASQTVSGERQEANTLTGKPWMYTCVIYHMTQASFAFMQYTAAMCSILYPFVSVYCILYRNSIIKLYYIIWNGIDVVHKWSFIFLILYNKYYCILIEIVHFQCNAIAHVSTVNIWLRLLF